MGRTTASKGKVLGHSGQPHRDLRIYEYEAQAAAKDETNFGDFPADS